MTVWGQGRPLRPAGLALPDGRNGRKADWYRGGMARPPGAPPCAQQCCYAAATMLPLSCQRQRRAGVSQRRSAGLAPLAERVPSNRRCTGSVPDPTRAPTPARSRARCCDGRRAGRRGRQGAGATGGVTFFLPWPRDAWPRPTPQIVVIRTRAAGDGLDVPRRNPARPTPSALAVGENATRDRCGC